MFHASFMHNSEGGNRPLKMKIGAEIFVVNLGLNTEFKNMLLSWIWHNLIITTVDE